jgi:outer membrane protein assembly factor BamB
MKRARGIWSSLSGGDKVVVAVVLMLVAVSSVVAVVALLKRPADISNPDVTFEAQTSAPIKAADRPDRRIDWPRYGYDIERTKFLNAQRVRPPFRKLWSYQQDELIEFAPIVVGKRLYMIDNDGVFIALDANTGKVVWKKQHGSLNASSPAFSKGVLYAVNLSPQQALAIRARDGKPIWKRELPARAESSPMVIRGKMYFGTESGDFFALRARNGKVIWTTKLSGAVKAAPAFSDGTLYVGDYAGQMYAIRASDGAIRWQTSDLGVGLGRSGRFYSTPAVAFGRVYAGNVDGRVYSFDRKSGEIAWTHSAGDYVYSGIAAAHTKGTRPAVYFGSHDRRAYALDAKSGSVIWQAAPGGQVSGPATVVGDIVYVSTFSGNATVGFDLKTGRRVFKLDDGEYGPVVSDGEHLFVLGGAAVIALEPVNLRGANYKANDGVKGVVPPAELRRIRRKQAKRERGNPAASGQQQDGPEQGGGPA